MSISKRFEQVRVMEQFTHRGAHYLKVPEAVLSTGQKFNCIWWHEEGKYCFMRPGARVMVEDDD